MSRSAILREIAFTSADLDGCAAFYAALGFEPLERRMLAAEALAPFGPGFERAERLVMRLGEQRVSFTAFDPPGDAYPEDSTSTDLWFQHIAIAAADMAAAAAIVSRLGRVRPITDDGPQHLPPNTGGVTAFKFRDFEGRPLELLAFPPGIGDAAWQERGGPTPFLGIDHSALAVGDLDRSLHFFRELGFVPVSRSLNEGREQQRLDDVAADRVDVVALAGAVATPHVELLAYRTGRRRPIPARQGPADIAATRLVVDREDVSRSLAAPRRQLVRDPDGHLVDITTRRAAGEP